VRSEGLYVNEKFLDIIWNRTSDLPICSTAPKPLCYRGPQILLMCFHILTLIKLRKIAIFPAPYCYAICGLSGCTTFFYIFLLAVKDLRKICIENEIYFSISPTKLSRKIFLILKRIQGDIIEKVVPHVMYAPFLSDLIQN